MENKDYQVLLYYCYAKIDDPEAYRLEHHLFCIKNKLKGRIIIASEGLNGTVSGTTEDCQAYMKYVLGDSRFAHTEFKQEQHEQHAFQKLHVRVKDEIVYSGLHNIDPNVKTGKYIEPQEFNEALKKDDDMVVLDVRSSYEHNVGHFKNAVTLDIENFRDFPEKLEELKKYKDKKVVTYCTGGIKCEKASAYLLENGFENVYQLHGGIIKYGIETDGEGFEGKCYVFDNRITTDINKKDPSVVSTCYVCGTNCDRMVNCANPECNKHVPICDKCAAELEGSCSEACAQHPEKREYDGTGYYQKEMNGYNPYKGISRSAKNS